MFRTLAIFLRKGRKEGRKGREKGKEMEKEKGKGMEKGEWEVGTAEKVGSMIEFNTGLREYRFFLCVSRVSCLVAAVCLNSQELAAAGIVWAHTTGAFFLEWLLMAAMFCFIAWHHLDIVDNSTALWRRNRSSKEKACYAVGVVLWVLMSILSAGRLFERPHGSCPAKAKSKGVVKGGGKEATKGGVKGGGKRKRQGRGKGARKGPWGSEGNRTRICYQRQCWTCGRYRSQVQEAGVDAVSSQREEPWIVGGVMEVPKEERWQRPKNVVHEKAKFMQECCVLEESRRRMERTLDARRPGVSAKNKFRELQVGVVDDDEEEDIAAELRGARCRGGRREC